MPAKPRPVRINGTNQDDYLSDKSFLVPLRISGLNGNDTLVGGLADDTLLGGGGDDLLYSGGGGGLMNGGQGTDVLILEGSIFDYSWTQGKGGTWEVTSLLTDDGTLVLRSIEKVQFDDYFLQPEIDDEVVLSAVDMTTEEDTMEFTFEAFDFDGDELRFVSAEIMSSDGPIVLEVVQEIQWHPFSDFTAANYVVGFAPLRPAEFFTWQYLAANEVAIESMEVTVSSTAADGTVSFFDVYFDITIIGQNDAPEATNGTYYPDDMLVVIGAYGGIDLNDLFTDVDATDTHTFSLTQTDGDAVSYEFDLTTGLITFTDVTGASSASFEWTVTDNYGASSTATLEVTFPSPPQGILIDFEEFSFEGGGHSSYSGPAIQIDEFIFDPLFFYVAETDEQAGAHLAHGNAPVDPVGANVALNWLRQTTWFASEDGSPFDFESVYMAFGGNNSDGSATTGTVTFYGYNDVTPGGTGQNPIVHSITIDGTSRLFEMPDTFDSVDYVRIVPGGGDLWLMDNLFLMPVEDVFA